MALYEVVGCLGVVVAQCKSTDECMSAVLREVQLTANHTQKFRAAIDKLSPGGLAYRDTLGIRIVVRRIE